MKSIKKTELIALILSVISFFIIAWFGIAIFIDFFIDKNTNINFNSIKLVIKNNIWQILFSTLGLSFILFISIIAYLQFFDKRKKGPKVLIKNKNRFLIDKRKKETSTKQDEKAFDKEIVSFTTIPTIPGTVIRWEPVSEGSKQIKWWVIPENHLKAVATTGGGKSQFIIIPNIIYNSLLPNESKANLVIVDPKGELYQNSANILKNKKFDVIRIDFGNGFKSTGWNPLSRIWDLLMSKNVTQVNEGIKEFNFLLNSIELLNSEKSSAPIWPIGAKNIIKSAMFLMLELGKLGHLDKSQFNFFNLKILVSDSNILIELLTFGSEQISRIKEIFSEYKATLTSPEATLGSFLANAGAALDIFNQELAMQSLLTRDEFDAVKFSEDSKYPKALFISYPDDDSTNHALISILISQIYSSATSQAKTNKSLALKRRMQFIIDEFGILTTIPNFDQWMNISRSRNIFFNVALQSDVQIKIKYPKTYQSIINGFNSNIFISSKDDKDHETLSKRIGKKDVENISISQNDKKDSSTSKNYSSREESLISMNELVTLGKYYVLETTSKIPAILQKYMAYEQFNLKNQASIIGEFKEFEIENTKVDFSKILNLFKLGLIDLNNPKKCDDIEFDEEDILKDIQEQIEE